MNARYLIPLLILAAGPGYGQGQDSQPYERDLQVVAEMLAGGFDNANQSYFDRRGDREIKHRRLHVDVSRISAESLGEHVFVASAYWDNDESADGGDQLWVLSADDVSKAVRMRAYPLEKTLQADAMLQGESLDEESA